jgi:hypothetical protein
MPANKPQPVKKDALDALSKRILLDRRLLVAYHKLSEHDRSAVLGLIENWTASRTSKN